MSYNSIFASTQAYHREVPVTAGTQPGVPLLVGKRPAITITAAGGATKTQTTGLPVGITSVTWSNGGIGNATDSATVAFDGTWELAVTGALTTTLSDVEVFYVAADGSLTLTAGTNAHYGWTDYPRDYRKTAGRAAVRIGA